MENHLVIGILNIIEDKLREFNIQLPDDDREESKDPIVGYQYAELYDRIKEFLEEEGVIEAEYPSARAQNEGLNAKFVSVWDGGFQVETDCKVNMKTGEIFDIEVSEGTADFVNELDEEFIRMPDGTEYAVARGEGNGAFWYGDNEVIEPVAEPKNTLISYLYRDADNYKTHNECVVKGTLSEEDKQTILDCLNDGEYFIPSQVGLPENRFDDGFSEADHCWFELDEYSFEETSAPPTVSISAAELVKAFCDRKDRWDDSFPIVNENNIHNIGVVLKPSLDKLIASASERVEPSSGQEKSKELEK